MRVGGREGGSEGGREGGCRLVIFWLQTPKLCQAIVVRVEQS